MNRNPNSLAGTPQLIVTVGLALAALGVMGCNARVLDPRVDSQSHWLKPCQYDADCGVLSCLCGICTSVCSNSAECNVVSGVQAKCSAPDPASPVQCPQLPANEAICVQDCDKGDCVVRATGGSTLTPAKKVPLCPAVAKTSDFPPMFFNTTLASYDGPATVNEVRQTQPGATGTDNTAVLVPNNLVGEHLDLRFNTSLVPSYLALGRRVEVSVRGGGQGSSAYSFIAVRDEANKVLLAYHTGRDQLFQDGMFATADAFGASISLEMLCQSPADGGCFKNQVQADYSGTFAADNQVTLDGWNHVELDMAGSPYQLTFNSTSVDGTPDPARGCMSDITPGRYLDFTVIAQ
jgi:hypothetical protein